MSDASVRGMALALAGVSCLAVPAFESVYTSLAVPEVPEVPEVPHADASVDAVISLLVNDAASATADSSSHMHRMASYVARGTVMLTTTVFESLPSYWLAVLMVVATVFIFLACWCLAICPAFPSNSLQPACV
mgnify:CR=1